MSGPKHKREIKKKRKKKEEQNQRSLSGALCLPLPSRGTFIQSQWKKVVTWAAAPLQDITGIYDVLNVSFVPRCGSSQRQLGKRSPATTSVQASGLQLQSESVSLCSTALAPSAGSHSKCFLIRPQFQYFIFIFFLMVFANTFLTRCWWTEPHANTWEESQSDLPPHRALPEINPNALFHFANQFRIGRAGLGERERYRLAVVITINHLWNAAMSHARLCH